MKKKILSFIFLFMAWQISAQVKENIDFKDYHQVETFFGKKFYYNNVTIYNQDNAPYPFVEGRLRYGKYKSSLTAFNNYVEQWKSYKNKVFILLKRAYVEDGAGYLFKSEEGDTIFYRTAAEPWLNMSPEEMEDLGHGDQSLLKQTEFVSVDYLNYLKESILNKVFVYLGCPITILDPLNPAHREFCVKNLKTGEIESELPLVKVGNTPTFSLWTVKEITLVKGLPYAKISNKQFGDYFVGIRHNFEEFDNGHFEIGEKAFYNLFRRLFIHKESLCISLKKWVDMCQKRKERIEELVNYRKGKAENENDDEAHHNLRTSLTRETFAIKSTINDLSSSLKPYIGQQALEKIDLLHGEKATPERFNEFICELYEMLK